ncbi:MAG: anthranilate phosphoribosyltransferase [Pirellulaceae bacterium]
MDDLNAILVTLQSQQDLTREQMQSAMGLLLTGRVAADPMREMLELMARKGESVAELAGAAHALRDAMFRVDPPSRPVVDTCGTGGDGSQTFNISTAAALSVASCGVLVAKHGNRKITSSTGSADVLAELGINLEASPDVAQKCLTELGICFCFAPYFHPAMKYVSEVRRAIGRPTIFNRLGPLANPALADRQVLGVGAAELQLPMAQALQQLGTVRSIVVRGEDGVDELSLSGGTRVLEVTPQELVEHNWHPSDFGLATADRRALFADDPASSAACIRRVLSGEHGPMRDVVVMNAAAALWIADVSSDLRDCALRVGEAIDSGATRSLVERLGAMTHADD